MMNLPPQHANAERMERRNLGPFRQLSAQQGGGALLHFGGRFVGERDGEDFSGSVPWRINSAMRCVTTRVLPVPAPANTNSGPLRVRTASRWGGLSGGWG